MKPDKYSITWEETKKSRRRLSAETGAIIKDWGGRLPFAFVYPNSYYIGMSNLGLQAVYGLLNGPEKMLCERVFWDNDNRGKGVVPLSVESQRPLTDFAVVAFSLNYEIDYLNIASILKASSIPVYSVERDEAHPLVIAGGPCIISNPMPVTPFFDCLCIGEAEALLPVILPVIAEKISSSRDDLLKALSSIPGIYVPRYPPVEAVIRQWTKNLDDYGVHSIVLTGNTELKNMYLIEVERGCAHGCRFCLVSNSFSPMRFHSLEKILEEAGNGLKFRKRIGLVGPAVTDHPRIEDLLSRLLEMHAQISISSLRVSSLSSEIMDMLVQGGLHSIALAPEAGSECLRRLIKKGIHEEDVLRAIDLAAKNNIQKLKLYFMVGLPQETDEDLQAIVDLALAGNDTIDRRRGKTRLSLNVSPFVPKAGTPFQRLPMAHPSLLDRRIKFLKNRLAHKGIQVKNESPQWSEVQAVLSRGNTDIARALTEVSGVSLPAWRLATEKQRIDVDYFAHQEWDPQIQLPWSIIR